MSTRARRRRLPVVAVESTNRGGGARAPMTPHVLLQIVDVRDEGYEKHMQWLVPSSVLDKRQRAALDAVHSFDVSALYWGTYDDDDDVPPGTHEFFAVLRAVSKCALPCEPREWLNTARFVGNRGQAELALFESAVLNTAVCTFPIEGALHAYVCQRIQEPVLIESTSTVIVCSGQ